MRPPNRSTTIWRSKTTTRRCRPRRCTRAASGRALARLVLSPLVRFVRFYVVKLGFLDGVAGLVHIAIGCQNSFIKYAKLRALEAEARR